MEGSGGGGGGGDDGGGANQLNPVVTDHPRQQLHQLKLGDPSLQVEEEASPISSRPPAMAVVPHSTSSSSAAGLFEAELLTAGGGNRWPRQETVALLNIRSEMDTTFRDANPKGPLWEEVSRKLGELGYKRSAKKCKEKFENVHKYYKRTKEGRAGRQDGKSYKFFTELEALTAATSSSSSMQPPLPQQPPPPPAAAAITAGTGAFSSPSPISSSIRFQQPNLMFSVTGPPPQPFSTANITPPLNFNRPAATNIGVSFSSDTNSSFANSDSSDSDRERKRKRTSSSSPPRNPAMMSSTSAAGNERMVEFFERLMNQVLQKQETMQQRFLEAIEKREHDRMIREEDWKRQESIRLGKEQELIAQERAMSASRDSAIITFLQRITGQTIQLPPPINPVPISMPPPPPPPPSSSTPTFATAEHQLPHDPVHEISNIAEPSSSRWPKAEILALIELRSGIDYKYQESGPKGPLWEEISAGMNRMGYKRNARRCKEKWENINKYYKKVKEGKKQRSEESKTCPYYHQLDELYRNKILGGVKHEEQQQQQLRLDEELGIARKETSGADGDEEVEGGLTANLFGESSAAKKPEEDSVRGTQQEQQFINYGKLDHDLGLDDEDDDEEEDMIEEDEEMKMGNYKIEFKGQNTASASNGGGNGAPSFLTMVQ